MTTVVGSVAELWRFPVKSMGGEQIPAAEVTERGVLGDRAYALIDTGSGKVVSAKSVRTFPDILRCRAALVAPPKPGQEAPPVRIDLPNGTSLTTDSPTVDRELSAFFRRGVRLARVAPDDYTIDMYHPDIEGADLKGRRDTVVDQKLGAALFAAIGVPSPVPAGSFFDCFPLSVLTTSTLSRLNEIRPQTRFDRRRFRMNVIVKTDEPGFVENGWVGRQLGLGEGARAKVAMLDSRCVMTTLAQDDLPQDIEVLRTLVAHNRVKSGGLGPAPCAGVYAVVAAPGTVHTGDRVDLA
jgi:MOSC domain-containing protein